MKNKFSLLFSILVFSLLILPQISLADALGVTGITAVKTSAMANGNYADGWKWLFGIHIPASESSSTTLKMKFGDWTNGSAIIPATNNIRLYCDQALNASTSDSALVITGANSYSDSLVLKDDPAGANGRNVQVTVEVRVPAGSTGGSYSTSYGVSSDGTTTPIVKEEPTIADLSVSLSPVSPVARNVSISPAGGQDTTDVLLAVYRFQSKNLASALSTLVFTVQTTPDLSSNLSSSMYNFRLSDGVNTYNASSVNSNTVTFSLQGGNILLLQDTSKDLTLKADIVGTSTQFSASTTLKVGQIVATDADYNMPTIGGVASPYSTSTDITGANATFINSEL